MNNENKRETLQITNYVVGSIIVVFMVLSIFLIGSCIFDCVCATSVDNFIVTHGTKITMLISLLSMSATLYLSLKLMEQSKLADDRSNRQIYEQNKIALLNKRMLIVEYNQKFIDYVISINALKTLMKENGQKTISKNVCAELLIKVKGYYELQEKCFFMNQNVKILFPNDINIIIGSDLIYTITTQYHQCMLDTKSILELFNQSFVRDKIQEDNQDIMFNFDVNQEIYCDLSILQDNLTKHIDNLCYATKI